MSKLTEDKREIKSVCGHGIRWDVGVDGVTKIEAYDEMGQMSYVPWIAIWVGDTIILRMDAQGKTICYI